MFEKVVIAILNKFLKPYVKKLDSSHLKVSVLKGNVVLTELEVKPNALDDLNLPVRIRGGFLQNLTLKIPWRSLYTARTVVTVKDLYLLVSPATEFKYDKAKAEKEAKEKKKDQLEQIEDKKRFEEEGLLKGEKSGKFIEKVVTQIVKNLELLIENVHVRYEDNVSDPDHSFAFGVTLEEISVKTTDSGYIEKVIKGSVDQIYKLLKLKCLAIYWNPSPRQMADLPLDEWKKNLFNGIARRDSSLPKENQYVLAPLTLTAELMLNNKPGVEMSVPRVLLNFVVEQISLHLSRRQFLQILHLLENFDMMVLNQKYIKYKAPGRPRGKENVRLWWKYAFNAVLFEDVRRRSRMWSWRHIRHHRRQAKSYRYLYLRKLVGKRYEKDQLEELEDRLDVYNITLARGLAEADARKRQEEKAAAKASKTKKKGFSRLFQKKTDKGVVTVAEVAGETIEISETEKKRLFEAIGYSDDSSIAEFPKEYVEIKLKFKLAFLVASVEGDNGCTLVNAKLVGTETGVELRPSANGISVHASASTLSVFGVDVEGFVPVLLQPRLLEPGQSLVSVSFEVNPLSQENVDNKLRVELQPSDITVDMPTINALISAFQLPENIQLETMFSAARDQLSHLREGGQASLQQALDQRSLFDVAIRGRSSCFILPENGRLTESSNIVVVDLGQFSIKSQLQEELPENASQQQLGDQAYDVFTLDVTEISAFVAPTRSVWEDSRHLPASPFYVIQPLGLELTLRKSIVPNDTRLPKVTLAAVLPAIEVSLSDKKIQTMIKIAESLPLPELARKPTKSTSNVDAGAQLPSLTQLGVSASKLDLASLGEKDDLPDLELEDTLDTLEDAVVVNEGERDSKVDSEEKPETNFVQFVGSFVLEKITAVMSEERGGGEAKPVCDFSLKSAKASVTMRAWDLVVESSIGPLALRDNGGTDKNLELLTCSPDAQLLSLKFLKTKVSSPELRVLNEVIATVSPLDITVEEESLHRLIDFFTRIVPQRSVLSEMVQEKAPEGLKLKGFSSKETKAVSLSLEASLKELGLVIMSGSRNLGELHVQEIEADVKVKTDLIDTTISVRDFFVVDGAENTKYKKIVQIADESDELFNAKVRVYNRDNKDQMLDLDCADVEVKLDGAALRVVFVNMFVQDLMNFALGFKPSDSVIETAKQTAAKVASAAKDKMKDNINTRIKFDIRLAAPCIIAPRSSCSDERLEANLGRIVLVDSLEVNLTRLELTRRGHSSGTDVMVVSPMELGVSVHRCLSSRHEGLPLVSVKGNLPKIEIKGGKEEIDFVFAFLEENINLEKMQQKKAAKTVPVEIATQETSVQALPEKSLDVKHSFAFQDTIADVRFELPEVSVAVLTERKPWLHFFIKSVTASVQVEDEHVGLDASLRMISLLDYSVQVESGDPLYVVVSPNETELIRFRLRKIDPASSRFVTDFASTEIEMALNITSLDVNLHETTILKALNFIDGLDLSKAPPPPLQVPSATVQKLPLPLEKPPYVKLKMDAKLNRLGVALMSRKALLADLSVDAPSIHLEEASEGNLSLQAKLEDLVLTDSRDGMEGGVKKIISRIAGTTNKFLVELDYAKPVHGERLVSASLNDFHIAGAVDFFLHTSYFVKTLISRGVSAKLKNIALEALERLRLSPQSIAFKINNMKLFLLENATSRKTRAVIAKFGASGHFHKADAKSQKLLLTVPDFSVHTCFYHEQATLSSEIVSPLSVKFVHSFDRETKEKKISVEASALTASISPHTVHIFLNIVKGGKATWKDLVPRPDEDVTVIETCPIDLWDSKPVDEGKWYCQSDASFEDRIAGKGVFNQKANVMERHRRALDKRESVFSSQSAVSECAIEKMLIEIERLDVKLENESKGWFYPVIALSGSASAELNNWSNELVCDAFLALELSYFNDRVAVWEPILEPVPMSRFKYSRWKLLVNVRKHQRETETAIPDDVSVAPISEEDEASEVDSMGSTTSTKADVSVPPAATALSVSSSDPLELTITKTGLNVIQKLIRVWTEQEQNPNDLSCAKSLSPYVIENKTGQQIRVLPGSTFSFLNDWGERGLDMKDDGTPCHLYYKCDTRGDVEVLSKTFDADCESLYGKKDHFISIKIEPFAELSNVPVSKTGQLLYILSAPERVALVCEIELVETQKIIRIRSALKIQNNLLLDVDVYVNGSNKPAIQLGCSEWYYVPLFDASTSTFSITPTGFGYRCSEKFSWKSETSASPWRRRCVGCSSSSDNIPEYVTRLVTEPETFINYSKIPREVPHHTMNLYVPLVLHNCLPRELLVRAEGVQADVKLAGGEKEDCNLLRVDAERGFTLVFVINDDLGFEWRGNATLNPNNKSDLIHLQLTSKSSEEKPMSMMFGIRLLVTKSVEAYIYAPYWIVNKTKSILQYMANGASYSVTQKSTNDALLFGFPKPGSKQKIRLKVCESEWSKLFSIDAAGSGGNIKCKKDDQIYEIGLQVRLTRFGLSRIVTFLPYQIVVNKTNEKIIMYEDGKTEDVEAGEWIPYWTKGMSGLMSLKLGSESEPESCKFAFNKAQSTLLKLEGTVRGVHVQVEISDSSSIITFMPYFVGSSPVRVENRLREDIPVTVFQRDEESAGVCVNSGTSQMFTWSNPNGKRVFCWKFHSFSERLFCNDLKQDSRGKMAFSKRDNIPVYCASFLDGLQRVYLFTDNKSEVFKATETDHIEQPDFELNVSLPSVGLSLVDDWQSKTVAYVGISSSNVTWEFKPEKKKHFQKESGELCLKLEAVYNDPSKAEGLGVAFDFSNPNDLKLIKPKAGSLKRTQYDGISFQCSLSPHHVFLHGIINRIQIDNQMNQKVFPVVFNPVPPPRSVAAPKPFVEASMVFSRTKASNSRQIKYLMVLVQEMAVRVDMGFIGSLIDLFTPERGDSKSGQLHTKRFQKDLEIVSRSIPETLKLKAISQDRRIYIGFLHLSPVKIHVSFSIDSSGMKAEESSQIRLPVNFVKFLLKSIGVALTDVEDVELRLAYFELTGQSRTKQQLIHGIRKHYTTQAIKQTYALILGLDVIGNPFGLVTDIKDGVFDLFYEPYQGAIQGPRQFAVGVAYGFQSLVSHTVGGVFGAVSRVTGTLGKGLATLSLDDEVIKERAQAKKPKDVKEGVAKGARGFLKGFVGGITGIVTKPVQGIVRAMPLGFFKGVGKGLLGVVARPVGGVVDFATSTFQGISKTADLEKVVCFQRPARFINQDKIIRPYCTHSATGNDILQVVDGGDFASDIYFAHAFTKPKTVLLLTNRHLIFSEESFLQGGKQKSIFFTPLAEIEKIFATAKGTLIIQLKVIKKSLFGKPEGQTRKEYPVPNEGVRNYAITKTYKAIKLFVPSSF